MLYIFFFSEIDQNSENREPFQNFLRKRKKTTRNEKFLLVMIQKTTISFFIHMYSCFESETKRKENYAGRKRPSNERKELKPKN